MLPSRAVRIVGFLLAGALLTGCGGSSSSDGGGTDGKSLFTGTCGTCHTLKDAGTSGTFGPNLDDIKPDKATVLKTIAEGPGSMPDHLFKGPQADKVATYVASVAGK
jgi:mono/diheme cytochrome c family protein